MSSPNPTKLALGLLLCVALVSLSVPFKGGLYLTNFEGDALHLADIVLRMSGGEAPHADFMTPLGALAFWPFVPFQSTLPLGLSYTAGQALVALALLPFIWRAATSRLPPATGWAFALLCVLLVTSLAHGDDRGITAVSMHYNRWAWVMVFVATVLTTLPPTGAPRPLLDGALSGLLLGAVAYLKVTYFVAFAPVLLLIALLRGDLRFLAAGIAVTAVTGAALFFPLNGMGYIADLLAVTNAPLRNAPGLPLQDLIIAPTYIAATLTLFAGAMILRRKGRGVEGLSILILFPAFLVVTWQNHGNDPLWLILLGTLLAAMWNTDRAITGAGLAALSAWVLAVPSITVHALSAPRHLTLPPASYTQMVPGRPEVADVHIPTRPAYLVRARTVLNDPGAPFAMLADRINEAQPATVAGEPLADCQLLTGITGTMEVLAQDMPSGTYVADMLSSHWLYTDQPPPPGAAPWNYGTDHGLTEASTLLVPLCPINARARSELLKLFEARTLTEISRNDRALTFRIEP
ncbi:MAG: hypothetical protein AAGA87_03630 [Pseudomonadota bacterium]